jgi:hypothetical protein
MLKPSCRITSKICLLQAGAILFFVACIGTAVAGPLNEPVGYELTISESLAVVKKPNDMKAAMMAAWTTPAELAKQRSEPYLCLQNTKVGGTGTAEIKDFYMTIGDSANNFDWAKIIKTPAGVTAKVIGLDKKNGGPQSDLLHIRFSGFLPGMKVIFQLDIDPDTNLLQFGDYRTTLFTLGGGSDTTGNSRHRVRFNDPSLPAGLEKFVTPWKAWSNPALDFDTNFGLMPRATYQMDHVQAFFTGNTGLQPVPEPSAFALAGFALAGLAVCYRRRGARS